MQPKAREKCGLARMAKILLITYEYPPVGGGTGKAAMNTARALARLGHEPAILTSRFKSQAAEERDGDVAIYRIPVLRRHVNYASAVEVLSFAASGLWYAKRIASRFLPDLTLAYLTIPCAIVSRRFQSLCGAPYFALLRGQDVPGYPQPSRRMHAMAWPVTSRLWRGAARVVANSDGLADLAREAAPWLKVGVVRNGIDLDLYRPAPRTARPARSLYVGRLVRHKRLRELILAWADARPKLPAGAELAFAGHGPERPILEKLAIDLGLDDSVRFLGRLDEPQVIQALQSSNLFINLSEGEGLPNAVIEAMACGLPTLLSDIPPHRELITDGVEGALVPGDDVSAISGALTRLLNADPSLEAMGRAARAKVERDFGWDAATRRLADLFPKL